MTETVFNVRSAPYSAAGNGSTDDTAAFQAAINAAALVKGTVYIPVANTGLSYFVGALDMTDKDGVTIIGEGEGSLITCRANGATANWMDLTESSYVSLRDFKVVSDSSHVPQTIFCWANIEPSASQQRLTMERITVDAFASAAILFIAGGSYGGFRDLTLTQRYNGTYAALNRALETTCLRLDAFNTTCITSAYQDISAPHGSTTCNNHVFDNCVIQELVTGLGTGTRSFDTAVCLVNANCITFVNGKIANRGTTCFLANTNTENLNLINTRLEASDGSVIVGYFMEFGLTGQTPVDNTGVIKLDSVLFSVAENGVIALGCPIGHLQIINPDVGGSVGAPFIGVVPGAAPISPWIYGPCLLQMQALPMQVFGSITNTVIIQQIGVVTQSYGTDSSLHVG